MKKLKYFFSLFLLIFSFNNIAIAYGDTDSLDDTCTEGIGILNRIVSDLTTLGLFSAYSDSFYIDGANGRGDYDDGCNADYYPSKTRSSDGDSSFTNETPVMHASTYCSEDDVECNSLPPCDPEGGMRICYNQLIFSEGCPLGCYEYDCRWVDASGWGPHWYWAPPGTISVVKSGDKICAQFDTSVGFQSIGCKYYPQCDQFSLTSDCFVADSCSKKEAQKSRAIVPISGIIIQCITESVNKLFVQTDGCTSDGSYTVSAFPEFQAGMRNAVRSCLMLYIILYGLRIVLATEVPSKSEMFIFGAKFVLVMYFSTGINTSSAGEKEVYADGITTYMKPLFMNGSSQLANMVYSAGGAEGLCSYREEDYDNGYSYLSLWDSIDCRILYYLGIDMSKIVGKDNIKVSDFEPLLLSLIMPGFVSFQLIFMVFTIVFFVFFVSIVIYFVNITVISIILLSILIYLAPVFVPMVLFEVTKGYYEGWLKLTASYALQPMVVAAYIAMMLTIYDQTVFGDCRFNETTKDVTDTSGTTREDIPVFEICDPDNDASCSTSATVCAEGEANCSLEENTAECEDTVGYILNPLQSSDADFTNEIDAIFFKIQILKSNVASDMLSGLVTLCLFGYLFFKFADMLSEFAGELTGGPGIGNAAGDPMALVKAAGEQVMKMGKAAMQGDNKSGAEVSKEGGDKSRSGASSTKESSDDKGSGATASGGGGNSSGASARKGS